MNEKVKGFLNAKKVAERKNYEKEKQSTLIELGLFDKVYAPDNKQSEEFSYFEWDSANSTNKYYKKVPVEITDEEFEEIKKCLEKEALQKDNPVATALTFIAWAVFICGFIAGGVLGDTVAEYSHEFSLGTAFTYWAVSFISGTMFLGFAEIIKLLEAIKRK